MGHTPDGAPGRSGAADPAAPGTETGRAWAGRMPPSACTQTLVLLHLSPAPALVSNKNT